MSEHLFWMICTGVGFVIIAILTVLLFFGLLGILVGFLAWVVDCSERGWEIIQQRWRNRA